MKTTLEFTDDELVLIASALTIARNQADETVKKFRGVSAAIVTNYTNLATEYNAMGQRFEALITPPHDCRASASDREDFHADL